MKLQELKAKVYELAQVHTTRQLKHKYERIKTLDMRQKASWEKALNFIKNNTSEFEAWLENPPNEYKDLFAEIAKTSQQYEQKALEAKQLAQEVLSIADNLEELAEEHHNEARHLEKEIKRAKQISKQSRLN